MNEDDLRRLAARLRRESDERELRRLATKYGYVVRREQDEDPKDV